MTDKIEVGKRYAITPKYKKSVEEVEFFTSDDGEKLITVSTVWRGGDYYITPVDEDEAEMLQDYLSEDNEDEIEITAFGEWELGSTWDGITVEFGFQGKYVWTEEEESDLTEKLEEDYCTYLEEAGYDSTDCEIYIYNGVNVEEMEEGYIDG